MISPVMYCGPDNKKRTVSDNSLIDAHRPAGTLLIISDVSLLSDGGRIAPRAMPLTLILGDNAKANDLVMDDKAAFEMV